MRVDENASYWSRALPAPGPPLDRELDVRCGDHRRRLRAGLAGRRPITCAACFPGDRSRCSRRAAAATAPPPATAACCCHRPAISYLVPDADAALDRRVHELTLANIAFLRQLQDDLGMDAEVDPTGALHALRSAAEARRAATDASRLRDRGIAVEFWNREQTTAAIGTSAYAGALFDPSAGHVHPGKLVALWKRAAEHSGAQIYECTPVARIEEGAVHTLTTATGERVRAPVVVLATNAYGTQLGYLRRAIAPVWSHVAVTPPLTEAELASPRLEPTRAVRRRSHRAVLSRPDARWPRAHRRWPGRLLVQRRRTERVGESHALPGPARRARAAVSGAARRAIRDRVELESGRHVDLTRRRRSAGRDVPTTSTMRSAIPATAST